ncbi:hypothetical protein [Streptomyces zaomyceticus]|uniref:hypothetical protein n=1 Tax=Streptomyces zaomyceticus TaxID=68286 RepID=UPI00341BC603
MSVSTTANLLSANVSGVETDATGWTAGANTTRARSTASFWQGAASLSMTATAAGSVTVTTTARVAVTAGVEYQAHTLVANGTATAGRATTIAVEWYNASVAGTLLSTSTGASTTLATSTSWLSPGAQVTATAPVGATYAVVRVTVTGLSAGAVVYIDAIAFGPPIGWQGNVIPYNTTSVETDASGWVAASNTTVDRFLTTDTWDGWYVQRLTSTAAGVVGSAMVTGAPVTAGAAYAAYAMVKSTPGSAVVTLAIRWYNVGGTLISTDTSPAWTLVGTAYSRIVAEGTAPVGATTARLAISSTAAAGGATWFVDLAGLAPAPIIPDSLLTFAEQSVEPATLGWTADSGCTVARSETRAFDSFASLRVAPVASTATVSITRAIPVSERESFRFSPTIWKPVSSVPARMDMIFSWRDASGTLISTTVGQWTLGSLEGWYQPVGSALAPDGTASVRLSLRFSEMTPTLGVYPERFIDRTTFGPGGLAVYAEPTAVGYGADIYVQGLTDGSYTTWSLTRWLADGSEQPVRGADGDIAGIPITSDRATAQDFEAPLGVPVQYKARIIHPIDGSRGSLSLPVTLPEPPTTDVVLKDVGQPARQAAVTAQELPQWARAARQAVHHVRGRSRPVVISDVRLARTGSLTLVTASAVERDALWWILDSGTTLLLQWPAVWGERDVYVQVGDVTEGRLTRFAEHGDRSWSLALTEVDRPVGGLAGSPDRTWDDIATDHDTWDEVLSTYGTWLDVYAGVA